MNDLINQWLDKLSNFLAAYPGLLPLIGVLLIIINLALNIFAPVSWLADTNLALHVGLILSLIGLLLIKPLG